jgi:hypothetical protein
MPMIRPARPKVGHPGSMRRLPPSLRMAALLLLPVVWLGCAKDVPTAPEHSSESLAAGRNITGRILGPDGRNICRTVGEGTMIVYLLNPEFDFTNTDFFDVEEVTCPDNSFSLTQEAATAHLRVELPINENLDALAWRNLDEEFTVPAAGVNHPVHVVEGTQLGGRATFEGQPVEGAPLNISYEFNPNYGATFGGSGPDGRWVEFFGRSPTILQNDVRYQVFGCEGGVLGAKQADLFPAAGFLFPSSRHAVNCRLETGPTTQFSHTATRLAVTPMPGDIGGAVSGDLFPQYGVGWGVQFPVPLGESPEHGPIRLSQMFNGGLMIGIPAEGGGPPRVLSGVDVSSAGMECGPFCRDLGFDGVVTFNPTGASSERKHVTWRYSDAGSIEGVGLEIIQHSVDGLRPHDYVLFRFRIRNTGPSTVRFFAGFFGDWDVQPDAFDDLGATALNGRLMYQVSESGSRIHLGTLLLGEAPVTGNYFFNFEQGLSVVDQIRALRGGLRATTAGPSDLRYIQGAGPISLDPREAQDVWLAVVAGESRSQLIANANAARDHMSSLVNTAISNASETARITTVRSSTPTTSHRPICKYCRPK